MDVASHAIDPPEPGARYEARRSASKTRGRLFDEKSPDKIGNDGDENLGLNHVFIVALTVQNVKAGKPGSSIAIGRRNQVFPPFQVLQLEVVSGLRKIPDAAEAFFIQTTARYYLGVDKKALRQVLERIGFQGRAQLLLPG